MFVGRGFYPDLDSAYRIFSILNDRGLDLSHSDILKSEIVGRIPQNQQVTYNDKWEEIEEELGRDAFGDLFGYVRMIFRKSKARETILKDFRDFALLEIGDSKKLIDGVLIPFAEAFATIRNASYESTTGAEHVNQMLNWLNRIDNTDWVPPAILYFARHKSEPKALHGFLVGLERLAAFLMICRLGINERIERYARVIQAVDDKMDLFAPESPLQLSDAESRSFMRELSGDIYRQVPKRRLYVLLRLDSALSDGSATYDHSMTSIEHVLPQNPPENSQWCHWFPTAELRDRWVHRLGNLVLLNHRKNSSASNYGFERKKTAYFVKGGVSPFPLTTQALRETDWTPLVVQRRQNELLERLKELWQIDADVPVDDLPPIDPDAFGELVDEEPVGFHQEIAARLIKHFGRELVKHSRVVWDTADGSTRVSCQASKRYDRSKQRFWFGLKRSTKESLESHANAFCAFGLGGAETVVLLPFSLVAENLGNFYTSPDDRGGILHWHISFSEVGDGIELAVFGRSIDVTKYLLKSDSQPDSSPVTPSARTTQQMG